MKPPDEIAKRAARLPFEIAERGFEAAAKVAAGALGATQTKTGFETPNSEQGIPYIPELRNAEVTEQWRNLKLYEEHLTLVNVFTSERHDVRTFPDMAQGIATMLKEEGVIDSGTVVGIHQILPRHPRMIPPEFLPERFRHIRILLKQLRIAPPLVPNPRWFDKRFAKPSAEKLGPAIKEITGVDPIVYSTPVALNEGDPVGSFNDVFQEFEPDVFGINDGETEIKVMERIEQVKKDELGRKLRGQELNGRETEKIIEGIRQKRTALIIIVARRATVEALEKLEALEEPEIEVLDELGIDKTELGSQRLDISGHAVLKQVKINFRKMKWGPKVPYVQRERAS